MHSQAHCGCVHAINSETPGLAGIPYPCGYFMLGYLDVPYWVPPTVPGARHEVTPNPKEHLRAVSWTCHIRRLTVSWLSLLQYGILPSWAHCNHDTKPNSIPCIIANKYSRSATVHEYGRKNQHMWREGIAVGKGMNRYINKRISNLQFSHNSTHIFNHHNF